MKHLLLIMLTYAAFVLETCWPQLLPTATFRLQLLPFLILLAFHWFKPAVAVVWAGIIGFWADTLSAGPLGIEMISAIVIMLLLQQVLTSPHSEAKTRLQTRSLSVFLLVLISLLITFGMIYLSAVLHLLWQRQLLDNPIPPLLPTCLCSAAVGATLWLLYRGSQRSPSPNSY